MNISELSTFIYKGGDKYANTSIPETEYPNHVSAEDLNLIASTLNKLITVVKTLNTTDNTLSLYNSEQDIKISELSSLLNSLYTKQLVEQLNYIQETKYNLLLTTTKNLLSASIYTNSNNITDLRTQLDIGKLTDVQLSEQVSLNSVNLELLSTRLDETLLTFNELKRTYR